MKQRYQLVRLEAAIYVAPDEPNEPPVRGDYRPEQVLAALQNWGDLEELRARGRMPTLLQCLYLDIQQAAKRLRGPDAYVTRNIMAGRLSQDGLLTFVAGQLCNLMNSGVYDRR